MPIQFNIDPGLAIVRVELRGEVAAPEVGDYRRALVSDPRFSASLPRLLDLREMALPPTTQEIRALAEAVLRPGERIRARRAVVARRDAVFGMFRMLELLLDGSAAPLIRVFRTEGEALDWLGRDAAGAGEARGAPPLAFQM